MSAPVDSLFDESRICDLDLGPGDDARPVDVALKLLLLDPSTGKSSQLRHHRAAPQH